MKLKKDDSDPKYKQKFKSKFFLPGFLPIYATIPECFKQIFEDNFEVKRDSLYSINNGKLIANKEFYIDQLIIQFKLENNLRNAVNSISNVLKTMTEEK